MDLSVLKSRGAGAFAALLALTFGASTIQATNVLTATSSVAVSRSTLTGPGSAASIVIKPVTALTLSNTLAVSFNAPGSGLVVTAPAITTLSTTNQTAGITFTVNAGPGCVGASTGAVVITLKAGGVADATSTANVTVSASASPLVAVPVTISCAKNGGVYTPGPAQTVSVTSAAAGGTPYYR